MNIFLDDARPYTDIIEKWIRRFRETLDEDPQFCVLSSGDSSGETPPGIKIIFSGYGLNPVTEQIDSDWEFYTVYISIDSLHLKEYPDQDTTPSGEIIVNLEEEIYIDGWYDVARGKYTIIPFENTNATELPPKHFYKIIENVDKKC